MAALHRTPRIDGYEVIRELGAGGMGHVYLARNLSLDVLHAVKVLRSVQPGHVDRLRQEAEIQRSIRHDHVVEVLEVVDSERGPALVMEYIAGPRLDDLLATPGPLDLNEVAHLGEGILEGAAAAHARGRVHRDLKPANILLAVTETVLVPKIADFGLAEPLDPDPDTNANPPGRAGLGTRRYMSLEQLTGQPSDPKMDVFALGAVLFELIEGRPAFSTEAAWHEALHSGVYPSVSRSDIPDAWADLVHDALAPHARRIADAGAMRARWVGRVVPTARFSAATLAWAHRLGTHPTPSTLGTSHLSAATAQHLTLCPRCRDQHRHTRGTVYTSSPQHPASTLHGAQAAPCDHRPSVPTAVLAMRGPVDPEGMADGTPIESSSDGLLFAFPTPADALRAARLSTSAAVCIGVHPEGSGPDAARLLSLVEGGHPGRILATPDIAEHLGIELSQTTSHGHWQVLGDPEPVELLEVRVDADAARMRPRDHSRAWSVLRSGLQWVPSQPVACDPPMWAGGFVGRQLALSRLSSMTADHRLITVHGPPAVGKSRLVAESLWRWRGSWPGGVWTCPLSQLQHPKAVLEAVAERLGVSLGSDEPLAQLGRALAHRGRCAVVLDDAEHLAEHLPELLQAWLEAAPELVVVVTSRQRLGMPDAQVFTVEPMGDDDGVELFHRRASEAQPTYDLDSHHADVKRLVAHLDGLPLAIELCASRVGSLTPAQNGAGIGRPLRLLTGGVGERTTSLRQAIDWSWELLDADERQGMAQLSVFAGPFDVEAAQAVLDLPSAGREPAELLERLVDAAMVVGRGKGSLELLHSLRAYAGEHLGAEARRAAEHRHGAWYARLGPPDAIERVAVDRHSARLDLITGELDNLTAAHRRAVARGDAQIASCCALAAWSSLKERGSATRGELLLHEAAAMPGASHRVRLEAAHTQIRDGELEDAEVALQALSSTDPADHARHREALAFLALRQGRHDRARGLFEAVVTLFEGVDDGPGQARATAALGNLSYDRGLYADAERHYLAGLQINRRIGSDRGIAIGLNALGNLSSAMGRNQPARDCYTRALDLFRQVGNRASEAVTLANLAGHLRRMGLFELARAHYAASLRGYRAMGNRRLEGLGRNGMGILAFEAGRPTEALEHYEAALRIQEAHHALDAAARVHHNLAGVLLDQGRVAAARDHVHRALVAHRALQGARGEALALGSAGSVAVVQGDLHEAEASFQAAITAFDALGLAAQARPVRLELGALQTWVGRLPEAEAQLSVADGGAEPCIGLFALRAELALAGGQPERARHALQDAMAVARARGDRRWAGRVELATARTYAAEADWERAVVHLDLALVALDAVQCRRWGVEALAWRARAAFELGHTGAGDAFLAEALAMGVHTDCTAQSPVVVALDAARGAR